MNLCNFAWLYESISYLGSNFSNMLQSIIVFFILLNTTIMNKKIAMTSAQHIKANIAM